MSATYGDLVGQAGADLHVGMIQVMRRRAHDGHHAANLVGAYYDLLVALRKHTVFGLTKEEVDRLSDPANAFWDEMFATDSKGQYLIDQLAEA